MKHLKKFETIKNTYPISYNTSIIKLRHCDENHPKVKNILKQYKHLSPEILNCLKKGGLKIIIFKGQLCDNPELENYKGLVPRNWPKDMTWDYVDGMYEEGLRKVFIGIEGSYYSTDKEKFPQWYIEHRDIFLHELGHAMDDILGESVYGYSVSKLKIIHSLTIKEPFKKNYYNRHVREYLANAFDMYFRSDETRNKLQKNHKTIFNILKEVEDLC